MRREKRKKKRRKSSTPVHREPFEIDNLQAVVVVVLQKFARVLPMREGRRERAQVGYAPKKHACE